FHFLPVLEEDQRRPQLDLERAAQAATARVGDLEVAYLRMRRHGGGEQGLRRAAVAAPGAAELEQGGAFERIDLAAPRLLVRVAGIHPHRCGIHSGLTGRAQPACPGGSPARVRIKTDACTSTR